MTREEARKKAEIMLAYVDGANIQFALQGTESWQPCKNPMFNFSDYDYRVQPDRNKGVLSMGRAIGETFDFNGVKLQVKDIGHEAVCDGCYFDESEHLCFNVHNLYRAGYCYGPNRSDGKNVIFVEVNNDKEDKQ